MTTRTRPYSQFNFRVTFGQDEGAFQEVSGLGIEINIAEYRNGNELANAPLKITGSYKVPDVTFKRGVINDPLLWDWITQMKNGAPEELRKIDITLLAEDRSDVKTWSLLRARPIKWTGPSLVGTGTELAIEELVVACEEITEEPAA